MWQSTEVALAYYDSRDPLGDLHKMLGENVGYEEIFIRVLKLCQGDGCSVKTLGDEIDDDPLLKKPFRTSGFFIGRLEKVNALTWEGAWKTTDSGLTFLEEVAAIDAEVEGK
jgi:hypothetical protein